MMKSLLVVLVLGLIVDSTVRDIRLRQKLAKANESLTVSAEKLERWAALNQVSTNVNWMGHPMFFEVDNGNGSFHWADDVELGCRGDGMVVWKRIPVDEKAPTIKTNRFGGVNALQLLR